MAANSIAKLAASFTGTGQSSSIALYGKYNLSLSGMSSSVVALERSFDGGTTWLTVQSLSANAELVGEEPERDVLYRFNCGTYGSGTIAARLSQ